MRIPLVSSVHAYPELDDLDLEQRRALLREASRNASYRRSAAAVTGITFVCSFIILFEIMVIGAGGAGVLHSASLVVILIPLLIATPLTLYASDLNLRAWLRARRQVGVVCTRCQYPLRGQRVRDGVVTCPECGAIYDDVSSLASESSSSSGRSPV